MSRGLLRGGGMLRLRIESLIIFSLFHARDKTKNIFLFFFTELKTYHLSYFSIYKHYAIDIADPSSTQDACYMNFVIELAHRGVRKTSFFNLHHVVDNSADA